MIPSPGLRAGSQVPEISCRGAGPFCGWAFTGLPQPSRSAGAGACCPFCTRGLSAEAFWTRTEDDTASRTNIIIAEATQHLCMFISGAQYTRTGLASQRLVFGKGMGMSLRPGLRDCLRQQGVALADVALRSSHRSSKACFAVGYIVPSLAGLRSEGLLSVGEEARVRVFVHPLRFNLRLLPGVFGLFVERIGGEFDQLHADFVGVVDI